MRDAVSLRVAHVGYLATGQADADVRLAAAILAVGDRKVDVQLVAVYFCDRVSPLQGHHALVLDLGAGDPRWRAPD